MSEPIDVAYVEIRPTPNAKGEFKRDVEDIVEPAAKQVTGRIGKAVGEGLKSSNVQTGLAAGAGAAFGTILGQGISRGMQTAMRGLTAIPRIGFQELKDYQAGLSQLEAGLKSTGGTAGRTAGEMEDLATSIQKYSGQTDDSIVQAESFLLTFDKIRDSVGKGNDVFTRTTKAAADLAARFGGDAASKSIMLGKALQDPVAGLTALNRAGIQFTAGQKSTIRSLTESGQILAAQKIVLAEVEKQVGGSAAAYGQTLPGQLDRAKRGFEDISQSIVGATYSFVDHNRKTTLALAGVVGGVYTAHKVVAAYQALQTTLLAGTARKAAANAALARSYDGVAAAAGRAAVAEGAAAGGAAGGVAPIVRPGVLATIGGAAAGILAAGIVVAVKEVLDRRSLDSTIDRQVEVATAAGPQAQIDLARRYGVTPGNAPNEAIFDPRGDPDKRAAGIELLRASRENLPINTQQLVDPRLGPAGRALADARGALNDPTRRQAAMNAVAGTLGAALAELPKRVKGDVTAAREAQRDADRAVADARADVLKARGGGTGATAAQIASAEAGVVSAQEAIRKRGGSSASEQARLEAAEARLSELREKGGVNVDKLRDAEDRLKEARRNAGQAADATKKAEETTALSVQDIVGRLGGQLKNSKALRDDSRTLIKNGISRGVLEELDKLEQTAPGTLDRVAKSMTPALAKQLNSQYADLQKVQQEFLVAPLRAAAEAAKAEQDKILADAAVSQAAAYQRALKANLFGSLTPPPPPGPDTPSAGNQRGDGIDHRRPSGAAVTVQLTGVKAQTVHDIASAEVVRADRTNAALIGGP